MADEKPKCPDHPDAGVAIARVPCSTNHVWICLTCAKVLGAAPPRPPDSWESFKLYR